MYTNSINNLFNNENYKVTNNKIDQLQKKLDDISINGFRLLILIFKICFPYFLFLIFLVKSNSGFSSLIILPLLPYLILIKKD